MRFGPLARISYLSPYRTGSVKVNTEPLQI